MTARRKIPLAAVRQPRNALEIVGPEPAKADQPQPKPAKPKKPKAEVKPQPPQLIGVFYRVTLEQKRALIKEAMRRADLGSRGKIDASEVLREALNFWMESQE